MQSAFSQPQLPIPISDRLGAPIMSQEACIAFVLSLLKRCLPFAGVWPVVRGGKPSADRVLLAWSWPHIFQKVSETTRPAPSIANGNAFCAVLFVAWITLAVTPTLNSLPAKVPIRPDHIPVGVLHPVRILPEQASATLGMSTAQVNGHYRNDVAAVASAEPARGRPGSYSGRSLDYDKVVESFSVQIEFFGHGAVMVESCRGEFAPEDAPQHAGVVRGIPLSGVTTNDGFIGNLNTKFA